MEWHKETREKFRAMVEKIPIFHRRITENVVVKKAQENARSRGASCIEEIDIVSAFFSGVPSPFYAMMVRLLEQNGFDYKKYGFPASGCKQQAAG
ncbi:MAG: hypothetical protein ACE5GG_06225 [Candidatus Omnitrophota bacterium]